MIEKFEVNEFITLDFDDVREETNIYISGKLFKQCMGLVMNIPKKDVYKFDSIQSIDEIEEYVPQSEIENNYSVSRGELPHIYYRYEEYERDISQEEEFQAYCSIFQAWDENDYNTELMHRTIAFPLLKRLVEAGDKKAKKIFEEEIAYRFSHGNRTVKEYLFNEGYLDFLSREELWILFPSFGNVLAEIEKKFSNRWELGISGISYKKKPTLWIDLYREDCSEDGMYLTINYFNHLSKSDWNQLFYQLSSIEELEMLGLSYNNLITIPNSISKLKNLTELHLWYNPLTILPHTIKNLPFLQVLELYRTDLKDNLDNSRLLNEFIENGIKISYKKKFSYE